jgi:LemA protein
MKGPKNIILWIVIGIVLILGVTGCNGYNGLVKQDEEVKRTWNNVNTEYQKRADLVDNLVNTVKGAANFEKETLTQLVEARAKATSINLTADQLTPENMAKFQQAQGQMSGALSRLLAVVENYPDLKANQNFLKYRKRYPRFTTDFQ